MTRHGEPVALPASAFDCLVYLIENRARPVGRDELISAVWGRADVSDNLLAQTVVRLRRMLGDAGNEQRCIKTVPRVGYRWMLEIAVQTRGPGRMQAQAVGEASGVARGASMPRPAKRVRPALLVALLLSLGLATVYAGLQFHRAEAAPAALQFDHSSAAVLPATVSGPEDWKWLQLGLMDLISNQLRSAKVPTESSQNVLNLLNQADKGQGGLASFALVISPRVTLVGNTWHVHLDAKSRDGHGWQAESSSADVLDAAHAASDLLLAQLGYSAGAGDHGGDSQQQYLLRIEAAQLAGHPDLAQSLIAQAPPDLRRTPEFAYAEADFLCNAGEVERCEQAFNDLLQQLPADKQILRGKVLTSLWYSYYRKHQLAQGEVALSEAVRLLQGQKDVEALACAYLDRAHLEFFDGKRDAAAMDLGLARINYTLAGDTVGQSKVDVSVAEIAMQRGQFTQALALLQQAYEHDRRMGMRELLSTPLQGLVYSHKMLLQFPDELATTEQYWPFEQKNMQFCDSYVRNALVMLRAMALADNGHTAEASAVLEQLLGQFKAGDDPAQRASVQALLAQLSLQRGETQAAMAWIAKAMQGSALVQDDDKRNAAEAWLGNVNILLRAGKTDELKRTVAAMHTWAAPLMAQDEWIRLDLMRATAAEAWSEGRREQALEQLKLAMALADKIGVPDLIVSVGQPYALALLSMGDVDQAVAVSGRLSSWSDQDWRAAWTEACVYRALNQMSAWETYRNKVQALAGDRPAPTEAAVLAF
ncbi:MAG TPA: winged helix-turn-helix domain-containing protein [Dyella sp.]|uniref:winged helix-turn-helix domain-containing protein n=1 Tax=Dyella sp. TaxID=1869338 RepID=UPI002CCE4693|nr:winged helix-turn-helix domain-containing protein [Dyella sp.]HUB92302.1 winged helix-turn-helix domain-containing protein [Dyella sp.]